MKRCIVTLILIGALAGCTKEDAERANQKVKEAGQEIKREVQEAGKGLKKGLEKAGAEIKKELEDDKRDSKAKDTSKPAR